MNSDASTAGNDAPAAEAWAGMQKFIAGEDRRRALRVELDLGVGKAELLIRLADAPMTLREIAQAVEVDPSAATVAVDRLERRGLVRRGAHPEDNRRKLVHLTDAGRQAAATAQRILTDPPPALAALDSDDLSALTRIFAALNSEAEPPTS
ncbi:MarR family winged helix-turn-helix transcriptional regulator [Actinacidiphila acididurans]|uniref:MarR family transcriptional regulator n=1 Tax=Actinacidiphila acididurans TaxID=2784346 RepID=A0ABS2TSB8_9ACTN|nr:MarR family transcriptional regulator [Actinacidiphila acididurans]MBM9506238.1 MarR family transcriptional regulator [Actinacidiphila acididurans]